MDINFESWLRKQKHRKCPIGDLAKDYIAACKMYGHHLLTLDKLMCMNACHGVIEAFKSAFQEYTDSQLKGST